MNAKVVGKVLRICQVRELLWPTGNNGPMLSTMNRLLRLLSLGGLLATSFLTSLTACAEGPPPQGAAYPTTSQAPTAEAPPPAANDAPASDTPATAPTSE